MTRTHPPRVALWLLEHFGPENEPLTGDLLEQYETRSRWWFWRQVLAALVIARFDRPREIRPLRLVDREPGEMAFSPAIERRTINLTASPVHGVGGLSLLTFAVLISIVAPEMWLIVSAAVLLGILLGVVLICLEARKVHSVHRGFLLHRGGGCPDRAHQPTGRA